MGPAITCSLTSTNACSSICCKILSCTPPRATSGTVASRMCTMGANSARCFTVCRWTRSCGPGGSPRQGGRLPPGSSSYKLKSSCWGGWVFQDLARSETRSPLPRPSPSSVPVGLSVAATWPGPQRSTAAHVATMSAVVAACDAEQLLWKPAR